VFSVCVELMSADGIERAVGYNRSLGWSLTASAWPQDPAASLFSLPSTLRRFLRLLKVISGRNFFTAHQNGP